jgi:hypothetical protein
MNAYQMTSQHAECVQTQLQSRRYGKQNIFEWSGLEKERAHLVDLAKKYKEAARIVSDECEENGMSRIGCVITAMKMDGVDNVVVSENSLKAGKALNALLRYQTMLVDEKNLHIDLVRATIVPILNRTDVRDTSEASVASGETDNTCEELLSKAKKSYLKKNEIDLR